MRQYVGLIHKEDASDYGVSFPDFPGVVTAGATLDEAREFAEQALAFHVEGMIEDGAPVPKPPPIEQIEADRDHPERASILVPLKIS
ncbi:type II toxin-antitoxin system HicB family antitoxin [Mesorhizobium sp. VK9D]|uniref:type II toxin-antitoxin system HicB family antitoxin n=1 Tax=Mesorhizobium australafricanum TaxID=3072311 RepID=UPI002A249698|nr:type II toxin-antitoxin system HicB family antitoxin [Mesorhizobium sp. VK9D]MDX8451165.1 type II toxin-antitoxin system HicB family antitoxin [Mesorhizobium sp. VK9D]